MKGAEASETGWPKLNVPDWLRPRTEALIAELGEAHPDVQLFVSILQAGVIDETIVDRLIRLVEEAETNDASQIAIDLSYDCTTAVAVLAAALEVLHGPTATKGSVTMP